MKNCKSCGEEFFAEKETDKFCQECEEDIYRENGELPDDEDLEELIEEDE
jgi:formylmethanofuran dehydrogenase subunit E